LIEWFKSIGALGELFAKIGALVLRGQPTASFTVRDEGTRKLGCIRITNNSDHDIAIIDACVKPEVYFPTEDMEEAGPVSTVNEMYEHNGAVIRDASTGIQRSGSLS
jgi:hypothetical protein